MGVAWLPGETGHLLAAPVALDAVAEETPHRAFSVRTFNDSKAVEPLKTALATLARRHGPGRGEPTRDEALRELRLTPNPTRVFLFGPWRLVSAGGQRITLDGFYPAVGVPSLLITGVQHAAVEAAHVKRVVCVENLVTFYEVIRSYPRRGWSSHVTTSAPRTGNSTR